MWILTQTDEMVNVDRIVRIYILPIPADETKSRILAETDGIATWLGEYKHNIVDSVFESMVKAIVGEYAAKLYIMPQE